MQGNGGSDEECTHELKRELKASISPLPSFAGY
jgi:hypothetical protein